MPAIIYVLFCVLAVICFSYAMRVRHLNRPHGGLRAANAHRHALPHFLRG